MISLFLFFILCKRCGRCCYYVLDGKTKKCKFLVELHFETFDKTKCITRTVTACRIYNNRLGVEISKGVYCGRRGFEDKRIIDGCPFNICSEKI